ncbi:protein delta homolog 1 isoform X3 [Heterocephalus glaber]|uniref:Protein delta homolog 1 isoform X3 n=1 Tax=Heterocephalus glaber TaxID=10181 RepID=A0AAX6RV11_HETGA|nr:protein delta homolog 1 isoform X3 [Heterocephalus glaber]
MTATAALLHVLLLLLAFGPDSSGAECLPVCDPKNGFCVDDVCRCQPGWQGDLCDQCVTFSGCVNGHCEEPGECICEDGWDGKLCNIDVRACTSTPCANNGTCMDLGSGHYECACVPGHSGKGCQKKDGPCVINGQFLRDRGQQLHPEPVRERRRVHRHRGRLSLPLPGWLHRQDLQPSGDHLHQQPVPERGHLPAAHPGRLLHHTGRAHRLGGAGHRDHHLHQQMRDLGVQPALQQHAAQEEEPAAALPQWGRHGGEHHLPREGQRNHLRQGGRRGGDLSSVPMGPSLFSGFRRAHHMRSVLIFVVEFAIFCVESGERYAYIYCLCVAV